MALACVCWFADVRPLGQFSRGLRCGGQQSGAMTRLACRHAARRCHSATRPYSSIHTMVVLFDRPAHRNAASMVLEELFPAVMCRMSEIKRPDHRRLAHFAQRVEDESLLQGDAAHAAPLQRMLDDIADLVINVGRGQYDTALVFVAVFVLIGKQGARKTRWLRTGQGRPVLQVVPFRKGEIVTEQQRFHDKQWSLIVAKAWADEANIADTITNIITFFVIVSPPKKIIKR